MRKPRKNRSVIGWELRRQLREPAGGCDDSMAGLYVCAFRGFATGREVAGALVASSCPLYKGSFWELPVDSRSYVLGLPYGVLNIESCPLLAGSRGPAERWSKNAGPSNGLSS